MPECDGCGWPTRHLTATDYGRVCDACLAGGPPPPIWTDGEIVEIVVPSAKL